MINKLHSGSDTLSVEKGMSWVSSTLQEVAQTWQMPFVKSHWEVSASNSEPTTYAFVVEGKKKMKAIKLFSKTELENCLANAELQDELRMRLLKVLSFVSASGEKPKTKS